MNNRWPYLLAWCLLIQPAYVQTVWKQIDTSPFAIKAEPDEGEPQNGPRQISYSPDGAFLAVANPRDASGSASPSGSVSIFSVEKQTGSLMELEDSPFSVDTTGGGRNTIGLAFSVLGAPTLATANNNDPVKLFSFNTQTGDLFNLRPVNNPGVCPINNQANSVTYGPGGKHVTATGNDNTNPDDLVSTYLVNQNTGDITCQQEITMLLDDPRSAAYYPIQINPSYVVIANRKSLNNVVVFTVDPDTGLLSNPKGFSLREGTDAISPHWVDFSPDGRFIAVAVIDGVEVRKFRATGFNAPTLLLLNNSTSFFPTPTSQEDVGVRSLAYSPNGRWLATANGNETVSLFCVDQETGVLFNRQELVVGHLGSEENDLSFSVTFSPDSRFLAVSNRDDNSISVFVNLSSGCPTCNTMINLLNTSSCSDCTTSVTT